MTLARRLLALVEGLGPDVCTWLFAETVRPRAFGTARIRNVLSHGFAASDGVPQLAVGHAEAIAGVNGGGFLLGEATRVRPVPFHFRPWQDDAWPVRPHKKGPYGVSAGSRGP
ncbi:hypothetical protein [Streptomyces hokutonensis]|uniref:hypothetical protein n=1 Tax=Streptomyces hokutonensis TaxID=1306990 RepID=UPI0036AF23FB